MTIMTSPGAIESDWLYACGSLTPEQVDQYWIATGEYDVCAHELTNLALTIAHDFKPKLLQLVKNELAGRKNEGIYNFFGAMVGLYEARVKLLLKTQASGNAQLGQGFVRQVMALVGSDLMDIAEEPGTDRRAKETIDHFISQQRRAAQEHTGVDFYGYQFHSEKSAYRQSLENPDNAASLDTVIGLKEALSEEGRAKIIKDNALFLATANEEALYKKIPLVTLHAAKPQIIFMRDDEASGQSYNRKLPAVRINFRANEQIGFPEFHQDKNGNLYCDYGIRANIVNCTIDPVTGDLCFITSGIPLHQVLPNDRYLVLQNYVLQQLKNYLTSKDPDIEDLFVYSPTELASQKERMAHEEEPAERTLLPDDVHEEPGDVLHPTRENEEAVLADTLPTQKAATEKPPEEGVFAIPKHVRATIMHRISGARPADIFAALRRLLGPEVRVEGDHFFFRSERTGIALPVPMHSRKSKNEIALNLLLNNLRVWQYSPLELAIELGVKIPEKVLKKL